MDRNEKFLKKLNEKELQAVFAALERIKSQNHQTLNIKKLTGHKDVYRARVGSIRIIFLENQSMTEILSISRRDERTYRKF